MTSFDRSQSGSHRGSWLYVDPYAYQYADLEPEQDIPASPVQQEIAAGSTSVSLKQYTQANEPCYELAADPLPGPRRSSVSTTSGTNRSCGLSRSHLSNGRGSGSRRYSARRESVRGGLVHTAPGSSIPQPANSGLIPILEDSHTPAENHKRDTLRTDLYPWPCPPVCDDGLIPVLEDSNSPAGRHARHPLTAPSYLRPRQPTYDEGLIPVLEDSRSSAKYLVRGPIAAQSYARPSQPAFDSGLMLADENVPKRRESSSDFDTILRNIGEVSKKGKGRVWRERGSRYYDRYSSNFG
ncbi:hypothetical protein F4861DRAFT_539733 [Xylaria intraflava]|nr:hypothetical protein F4861DRAFT_539733 [Xylaria intraflava]